MLLIEQGRWASNISGVFEIDAFEAVGTKSGL